MNPYFNISFFPDKECGKAVDAFLLDNISKSENEHIVYMIDPETKEELTYGELVKKSFQLAAGLQALGCEPQSVIGIVSGNCIEYSMAILGAWLAGATVCCFDSSYTIEDLEHAISRAGPSFIFCSPDNYDKVTRVNHRVECKNIVLFSSTVENTKVDILFSSLIRNSGENYKKFTNSFDDTALILFHKEATGSPIGRTYSHATFIFNMKRVTEKNDFEGNITIDATEKYHFSGFLSNLVSIARCETRIMMEKFDPDRMLSLIEEYKIKFVHMSGDSIAFTVENLEKYDLSSLKCISYAGAPFRREIAEEIQRKMNLKSLKPMFEPAHLFECPHRRKIRKTRAFLISLIGDTQVKVINTRTGKTELTPYTLGELYVTHPRLKEDCGRFEKPTEKFKPFIDKDGWLHTRCLAVYDKNGGVFSMSSQSRMTINIPWLYYKTFQMIVAAVMRYLMEE